MLKKSVVAFTVVLLSIVSHAAYAAISCPVPPGYDAIVNPICYETTECTMHQVCKQETICVQEEVGECPEGKTMVCHIPPGDVANAHTICVGDPSVIKYHLDHGDYLGACNIGCEDRLVCHYEKCCREVTKCVCPSFAEDWNSALPDAGLPSDTGPSFRIAAEPDMTVEVPDSGVVEQGLSVVETPDAGVEPSGVGPDKSTLNMVIGMCQCPEGFTNVPTSPPPQAEEDEVEPQLVGGGCSVGDSFSTVNLSLILGVVLLLYGAWRKSMIIIVFACLIMVSGSVYGCFIIQH